MKPEKIMFEIYRERDYNRMYRVVYFTELHEVNRETEINRAVSGEYILDGFILESHLVEAKAKIEALLRRINGGEDVTTVGIYEALAEFAILSSAEKQKQ